MTIEEYFLQLRDSPALLAYIKSHPNATPEEVLSHFGIPFYQDIWNKTVAAYEDSGREFPRDPAWSTRRS